MTATVAGIHLGIDTHANRPAANTVPDGSIYSCSTHSLIYKSNLAGNSWATWATLGTTVAAGALLDYVQITSAATITNTTEATADIVITSSATVFDGTACWFEFYSPQLICPTNVFLLVLLFDNTASTSASIGRFVNVTNGGSISEGGTFRRKITPSAGTRTYSVRAIVASGSGTVGAGAGGAAAYMPAYLAITKA